jgi:Glyoxalase-like domain
MPTSAALDHIILLVPFSYISKLPAFFADNFTIYPGGRHADGKTENVLIVFQSGVYLELIAFIDDKPSHREGHWWGGKGYGWIDWALTSSDVKDVEAVRHRMHKGSSVEYDEPKNGGRRKPDGTKIEWQVTFPASTVERGSLPFFCHDVTLRELRVPVRKGLAQHPCGATGVRDVRLVTRSGNVDRLVDIYKTLLDCGDSSSGSATGSRSFTVVQPVMDVPPSTVRITIGPPQSPVEEALLTSDPHSAALAEITLQVGKEVKPPPDHAEDIDGFKVAFGFAH